MVDIATPWSHVFDNFMIFKQALDDLFEYSVQNSGSKTSVTSKSKVVIKDLKMPVITQILQWMKLITFC